MRNHPDPRREEFHSRLSIQLYFSLIVMAEIILTVVIAAVAAFLLEERLTRLLDVSPLVWIILLSAAIGTAFAFLVNRIILQPIKRLSRSMQAVAGGNYNITVGTFSRVHEIQDSYRSFNLMTRELAATEILQSDFVSNVSHEFKTPINAIEGYATLLQDENLTDAERRSYTDKILFSTRRLSELVGNILLLSKVDSQSIGGRVTALRLDEQLRQALLLLESKWSAKDIDFDIELESIEYRGEELLLRHVWSNLIDNAVKFSPPGGLVSLRLSRTEAGPLFVIEDGGPGIPPEDMDHIFDRFFQSDSSHKAEGSGLGLALVKRILDRCGGQVKAENRPEGGCRFSVQLPPEAP